MHHKTKEAAIKKLKLDNPGITDDEIQVHLEAMETPEEVNPLPGKPGGELAAALARIRELESKLPAPQSHINHEALAKMKKYDRWRGMWVSHKEERIPGTVNKLITEWIFETLDVKPLGTGIPLHFKDYKLFNDTHFMAKGKTPTEILYPAGTKEEVVFYIDDDGKWQQRIHKHEMA